MSAGSLLACLLASDFHVLHRAFSPTPAAVAGGAQVCEAVR